jgi:ABC-type dipeptide/oligopeptide/nickel transport system permease subunit
MEKTGKISSLVLIIITLVSFLAPVVSSYDPNAIDLMSLREPPSIQHPLGTDHKGRDILTRVLYGGRISIGISLFAAFSSMGIGLIIGICSGYFGGKIDTGIMAFVDMILAFPSLLLAIGISILFPAGIYTVIIAIVAVGWASFARLVRSHVLSLKESTFIEAAKTVGCNNVRILFRHIMPQCIPLMLVMTGLRIGGFLLTESSLSFLGLGAQPPTATWGSMISMNRAYISSAPWMVFFPGFMIAITALCFNILGDCVRERLGFTVRH